METSQLSIVDRLRKRQRLGRVKMYESLDSIVSKLENFIDKDNSENSDSEFQTQISDLFEDIKHDEPLRAVCKEHRETYAYISKLGKEIDNMNTMNPEDLQSLKVAQLDESIIDRVIHEYLMLEGMFDEAEILQLIKKIQCEMVDAKDQFKMIYQVLKSLEDGDVDFALKWVEENSSALKSSNNLQFNLHKLKILDLLRKKDSISAIDYTRAHLHVFHNTHLGEIQQLLGACLFLSQPENSHYQELLDPGYNKVIAQELIHE